MPLSGPFKLDCLSCLLLDFERIRREMCVSMLRTENEVRDELGELVHILD